VASTLARFGPADWAITAAQALGHDLALPDVARELARRGLADDALRAARALEHSWNRDRTLSDIADILARQGERTQALAAAAALLETSEEGHRSAAAYDMERAIERAALALAENGHIDDALAAAQAAGSPWKTGQILVKVACAVGQAGDLDRATRIASEITPGSASAEAFGQLAETLANEGRAADAIRLADMALEVSQTSPSNPTEAEALAQLAVLLHAVGDIPAAVALAESAVSLVGPDPEAGGNAIVLAASAFAEAGDSARAISLAVQAAAAARTAVHAEVKAAILAVTAPVLGRAGDADLAAETARDALAVLRANRGIDFYRSDHVAATASSVLAIVAEVGEALAGLDLIHFSAAKTEALSRIAAELARRGQRGQLLALAQDRYIFDRLSGADRVAALADVAAALVTAGEPDQATALAEEARSDIEGLSEPGDRALAIPHLALLLAHLGRTEEAATAAAEAQNLLAQTPGGQGGRAIMTTVQALVQAGQTNQALALAQDTRGVTQNQRAESLLAVAAALTSAEDEEQAGAALVNEAFTEVRISWHEETRKDFYRLLCELLPRHPDLLRAWLPGAGKISQLVQELAAIEGWWRDGKSDTHITAYGWRVPFRQT
jgi:tetratricopeptide (TPR) repeat protein